MIEILGKNIENLFENTDNRKYCSEKYDIWEVSDEYHKNLCDMSVGEFYQRCPNGWWRSAIGSNLGEPDGDFIVNGHHILAFRGETRKNYFSEFCEDCSDYIDNRCKANEEDISYCSGKMKYDNLIDYLGKELGIGMEKNICAVCVDLAKYNNMTMAELFKKYQG